MYSQLTRSKALDKSILRIMLLRCLVQMEWMASWAEPMASWIFLDSRKENFWEAICLERIGLSQLAIIFEIILYRQLHKEIGL